MRHVIVFTRQAFNQSAREGGIIFNQQQAAVRRHARQHTARSVLNGVPRDFVPSGYGGEYPVVLAARRGLGVSTVRELFALDPRAVEAVVRPTVELDEGDAR